MKPNGIQLELLSDPPRAVDTAILPSSEVLRHFEEWDYRGQGHDFVELELRDGVIEHLEEWDFGEQSDAIEDPVGAVPRTEMTSTPRPPQSDRAHPLWDKELDG